MASFPAAIVAPTYNFGKDMFLFLKGERQDIKDLQDRMSTLIAHLSSINSEKVKIDQKLSYSVHREKSIEYPVTESRIRVVHNKFIKFIKKYVRVSGNPLRVTTENLMITELESLKSKVATFKFFKLADLSRDIAKLSKQACEVLDRLKWEFMTMKKSGTIQEKLDDNNYNLPVFDKYVDEVLDYLGEEGNRTVGIFGPKGVGKTTVLRKLYNKLIESRGDIRYDFKHVIMTEYPAELETQEKIVQKLQKEIMCQLSIDHEASPTGSIQHNRNAISAFLCGKKYILLMDQVSREVDLGSLGLKEHHKYKNVVMASTELKAIRKMTEHKIEIKRLDEEEGRILFENICGELNEERKIEIAVMIIKCCAGIPWLIRHIATHLKDKKDDRSWNNAKRILQSEPKSDELIDLGEFSKVYEIEYDKLGKEIKKCLLYGALFPIQYKIYADYLVECWIAEGFIFVDDAHKVRAARDHGQGILDYLTGMHLLQWCCDKQYIMMPPDFRRVALELDYPDEENCVIWMPFKRGILNEETWKDVKRMSLIGCNVEYLPHSPQSCNIYTLLLQFLKPNLEQLADSFFLPMEKLQVLDLNHTEIRALPESINSLKNLKSLYLNDCMNLNKLPSEAETLKKLEFLDICGTSISSLPEEIRHMVDLRCLRATLSVERFIHNSKGKQVENLKIIPSDIISNLRKLEELSIDTTIDSGDGIAMAKELASLEYLNKLCFNFPDVSSLDTFVSESKALKNKDTEWKSATFRSFKISIGPHGTQHPYDSDFSGILAERWLRYYHSTNEAFSQACQELLNQASAFEIAGHHGVESLNQFDMRSVKACVVGSCNKLKCIVDGYTATEEHGFVGERLPRSMEKLYLYNLDMLECIWDGPVPSQSLANLTAIAINGCNKLTSIFCSDLAQNLQSLEKLKVENCCNVLTIIEVDGRSNNSERCETSEIVEVLEESGNSEERDLSSILKSLRTIEISNLPELQSICTNDSISWKSLNSIIVKSCSNLKKLSLTCTNAKKLVMIQGEEDWWRSVEFPEKLDQSLLPFHSLTRESSEPGPGTRPEEAASSSGRSDFNGAVMAHFEEAITDQHITSSNNSSIDPPAPLDNKDFGPYLRNGISGGKNRREKEESVEPFTVEVLHEEGYIQSLNEGGTNDSTVQGVGIET